MIGGRGLVRLSIEFTRGRREMLGVRSTGARGWPVSGMAPYTTATSQLRREKKARAGGMLPPSCAALATSAGAESSSLRQVASDKGLDLRPCVAVIETRLNQLLPGNDEIRLRREEIDECAGTERITLLADAQRFFARANADLLHAHLLFVVPQESDLRDDR